MCRSIQTLRPPYTEAVTPADVRAAALQYVRKISGMRAPAPHNREVFDRAVDDVTAATEALLRDLVVRGARTSARTRDRLRHSPDQGLGAPPSAADPVAW